MKISNFRAMMPVSHSSPYFLTSHIKIMQFKEPSHKKISGLKIVKKIIFDKLVVSFYFYGIYSCISQYIIYLTFSNKKYLKKQFLIYLILVWNNYLRPASSIKKIFLTSVVFTLLSWFMSALKKKYSAPFGLSPKLCKCEVCSSLLRNISPVKKEKVETDSVKDFN